MKQQNKSSRCTRCTFCNIKVKLNGWSCRCDDTILFCDKHRLPFDHNCTYDFKKDHSDKLKLSNVRCIKEKVKQI